MIIDRMIEVGVHTVIDILRVCRSRFISAFKNKFYKIPDFCEMVINPVMGSN